MSMVATATLRYQLPINLGGILIVDSPYILDIKDKAVDSWSGMTSVSDLVRSYEAVVAQTATDGAYSQQRRRYLYEHS